MESHRRPEPTLRGAVTLDNSSKVCVSHVGTRGLTVRTLCTELTGWGLLGKRLCPRQGGVSLIRDNSPRYWLPRAVCQQHLGAKSFVPIGADHQGVRDQRRWIKENPEISDQVRYMHKIRQLEKRC